MIELGLSEVWSIIFVDTSFSLVIRIQEVLEVSSLGVHGPQ